MDFHLWGCESALRILTVGFLLMFSSTFLAQVGFAGNECPEQVNELRLTVDACNTYGDTTKVKGLGTSHNVKIDCSGAPTNC